MASYSVNAPAIGAYAKTLVASTVDTVTFDRDVNEVEVVTDGSAATYVTTDGSTPTVAGGATILVPAGVAARRIPVSSVTQAATGGTVVKLISAGTPVYSVAETFGAVIGGGAGGGGGGGSVTQGTSPWVTSVTGTASVTEVDHVNSLATVFASAARTATPTAAQVSHLYGNAATLYFNATVTPNNTETITIAIRGVDPVTGNSKTLITLPPIKASALGATPTAGSGILVFELNGLPRVFDILPTHSAAGSWTYSIGVHTMLGDRHAPTASSGSSSSTTASVTTSDAEIVAPNGRRVELVLSSPSAASGDVWLAYGSATAVVGTGTRIAAGGSLIEDRSSEAIRAISSSGTVTLGVVEKSR